MKTVEFCYWLQGLFELGDTTGGISSEKAELIKRHLAMVFKHEIDASYGTGQQSVLDAIHNAPKIGGTGPDGTIYRC